jgi:hypothetical protein
MIIANILVPQSLPSLLPTPWGHRANNTQHSKSSIMLVLMTALPSGNTTPSKMLLDHFSPPYAKEYCTSSTSPPSSTTSSAPFSSPMLTMMIITMMTMSSQQSAVFMHWYRSFVTTPVVRAISVGWGFQVVVMAIMISLTTDFHPLHLV